MATVRFISTFVALAVFIQTLVYGKQLPDFIHTCRRSDPNLIDCVMHSVLDLQPLLAKGIPELSVPSIEPLHIKEIIVAGSTNSLFKVSATDIDAYGCSNFIINRLEADLKEYQFSFGLDLPLLNIEGRYDVDGRILLIPIKGNGPMKINITDCKAEVKVDGELFQKDGEEYIRFTSMDIKFVIGKGSVLLENLFGGEKTLGDAINVAINANFDGFLTELKPSIERELAVTMLEISNNIVRDFTAEQLLPN